MIHYIRISDICTYSSHVAEKVLILQGLINITTQIFRQFLCITTRYKNIIKTTPVAKSVLYQCFYKKPYSCNCCKGAGTSNPSIFVFIVCWYVATVVIVTSAHCAQLSAAMVPDDDNLKPGKLFSALMIYFVTSNMCCQININLMFIPDAMKSSFVIFCEEIEKRTIIFQRVFTFWHFTLIYI